MGSALSNLVCHAIGHLYPSYTSYRALKHNATNVDLVERLITWMLVTALLIFAENVTDPLLGFWFPLYYPAKIAFVAWMVYPGTQGANFLFVKHLEPAIRELTEEFGAVA